MQEIDPPLVWYKKPILWGWVGTAVVVAIGIVSAILPACATDFWGNVSCVSKGSYLWSATPNELGDTLAGFAGALAFIWIIVTVAMQSLELAAQRVELKLTRKEFERMAEAQGQQVDLLVKQGDIFRDEQRQRKEERAQKLLEQKMEVLRDTIERNLASFEVFAPPDLTIRFFRDVYRGTASGKTGFANFKYIDLPIETYFQKRLSGFRENLKEYFENEKSLLTFSFSADSHELFGQLERMFDALWVDGLGDDQVTRLERIGSTIWIDRLKFAQTQKSVSNA